MGFMKLLELENFKSYKGHQIVGPFMKFTAIIGPNGSGKSNLMDAISFVLGERTQNLRVRSLKDLIHGAPIGKPVASRAKVVLVYQEDDGKETSFARIIIGSGSEYRINGKVVPHGIYHTKLESFQVFLKAKNCLVFQGAVESIALKTSKERTHLFEEISGSGEHAGDYDKKKLAMSQASEDATLSFQKKKGIVAEKKEARAEKEEAEKYKKLQEDYDEGRLTEQLFNLYHSEKRITTTAELIKDKQKELDKQLGVRGKLEGQIKGKKQENAKWSREVATLEKKMREKEVEMNQTKPLYIKAKEKTSHVAKRLEANKKAHAKAVEKEKQHRATLDSLATELEDVRGRSEVYEDEVASQSQDEGLQLVDSQLKDYYRLQAKADKKSTSHTQELETLELEKRTDIEALEVFKLKKEELLNRQKQLQERRELQEERVEKIDSFIESNAQVMSQLKNEEEKLASEMSQASTRYEELSDALGKVQKGMSELDCDRHESKRRQRNTETLENLKRLYPGVYGKVVELCEPVHSRYSVAVAKVLGKNLEGVVVDQAKTGRDCIQYLKEQRVEPIMFIPLDTVDVSPTNEAFRSLGGSCKLVYDIIKFDNPAVTRAIQFACGNSVVCDTMEEARRTAYSGERKRVVSLDGTLFQKNGIISGGTSDIKSRARAFDEKKVDALSRKRDRFMTELKAVAEVKRKDPELRNITAKISTLEMRLKHSRRDKQLSEEQTLPNIRREMTSIEGELGTIEPKMARAQASIDKRNAAINKLQSKIDRLEDEVFRDFCASIGIANIREFQEKQVKEKEIRAKKRLEFAELISRLQNQLDFERRRNTAAMVQKHARTIRDDESSIVALNEDEAEKLAAIEELETELEQLQGQRQSIKTQTDQKDLEMSELRKMLGNAMRGITQLQKKINTLETELDQRKADRHSLLKGCKMDNIKIPMDRGSMDDIGDEGPSISSQSESIGMSTQMMDVDSMTSQGARVLYERESNIRIDYSQLDRKLRQVKDGDVREAAQELNNKLLKLQATLDRFTAPNMRALEKLEGVESRLQETSDAFEHYRHLSKKTKTEFEQIKKLRLEKFSDALDHVAGEIDQIYKKLSNNASAQAFISADNAEEPYLEGISYNCIAPGKRFRPMDNLSGGEKTVAALALLFAIHGYQSAPFFVLDEIDAALDNTNINRVARYIMDKTREGSFQCVVISLKEEFYCHADALIGIYSQVGGDCTVSETVTLDLTQYPVVTSPVKARH